MAQTSLVNKALLLGVFIILIIVVAGFYFLSKKNEN